MTAATDPNQPRDHERKQPTGFQPLCSLLLVPSAVNYMRHLTLLYKTEFEINDFAQLEANVSVLSTVRVGEAKL